jgi:carboxylesterase
MLKFGLNEETSKRWKDEPILLAGDLPVWIILFHGWSSIPKQVNSLAETLHRQGYSVYVPRLKGHGTVPEDLENATWKDWINQAIKEITEIKKEYPAHRIFIGGTSMGGNLALIASQEVEVDGIITVGTPVLLKKHFLIWLGVLLAPLVFKKYQKKRYPKKVKQEKDKLEYTSYQYFPIKSVRQVLKVISYSIRSLQRVTAPILIMQTNTDYLVSKISPHLIYYLVSSRHKQIQWLQSMNSTHILVSEDVPEFFPTVTKFIEKLK